MDKGAEQAWSLDAQVPDLALVLLNKRYDMLFCLYAHFVYPFQHQALQTSLAHTIPSAHPMAPSWLPPGGRLAAASGQVASADLPLHIPQAVQCQFCET
jgi:hypothetical protein